MIAALLLLLFYLCNAKEKFTPGNNPALTFQNSAPFPVFLTVRDLSYTLIPGTTDKYTYDSTDVLMTLSIASGATKTFTPPKEVGWLSVTGKEGVIPFSYYVSMYGMSPGVKQITYNAQFNALLLGSHAPPSQPPICNATVTNKTGSNIYLSDIEDLTTVKISPGQTVDRSVSYLCVSGLMGDAPLTFDADAFVNLNRSVVRNGATLEWA